MRRFPGYALGHSGGKRAEHKFQPSKICQQFMNKQFDEVNYCTYMHMYVYAHVCVCTCMCMYMYVYVHVCVCTCMCIVNIVMFLGVSSNNCTCVHVVVDHVCVVVDHVCVSCGSCVC